MKDEEPGLGDAESEIVTLSFTLLAESLDLLKAIQLVCEDRLEELVTQRPGLTLTDEQKIALIHSLVGQYLSEAKNTGALIDMLTEQGLAKD